jgi:hypothetical protein
LLLTGLALAEWRVWTQRARGRWSYWVCVGSPFVVVFALVPITALIVAVGVLFDL